MGSREKAAVDEGRYGSADAQEQNVPDTKDDRERLNGWYFPELEGPDVTRHLAPGEREFWEDLQTSSISEIWGLDLESEPAEPDDKSS